MLTAPQRTRARSVSDAASSSLPEGSSGSSKACFHAAAWSTAVRVRTPSRSKRHAETAPGRRRRIRLRLRAAWVALRFVGQHEAAHGLGEPVGLVGGGDV